MTAPRIAGMTGYTLLRELGRGGMAVVYLAEQQSLGREVALKVMPPGSDQDPTLAERFLREARIAANLHHPHIVAIHDFGVHDGSLFIAMEYEPGGNVSPSRGECLEPRAALRIVRDIASALDYAHGRGVVHRDVKPENILRRADGAAMLSDFGIARMMHGESVLTVEGTSVGTPHYMSPEQLRGDNIDGRSDLYSLGVVLWQLLTGELPYAGADAWAIGSQHLNADIPRLPPDLSTLQPLLDRLMAKKAEHRPHAGLEVVALIDALLTGNPTPVTVAVSAATKLEPSATRTRQHLTLALVGCLVLVLVAGFAWRKAWMAWHVGESAPAASARQRTIAVLPFVNISDDASNQYFSDGISEELLNVLARVDGFDVASRTSSFAFRKGELGASEIARRLKVNYLLEGSVRKSANRVRITAQLVDAGNERQVWSETYDREMTDIFAVQDDIANAIARALQGSLPRDPGLAIHVGAATSSTQAYELYLRARELFLARTRLDESVHLYEKAISIDPAFKRAWEGLAAAAVVAESWGVKDRDYTEIARESAEKALQLDSGLALPWGVLGMVEIERRPADWEKALSLVDKSLALDPKNPTVYLWRSGMFARLGFFDRAIADQDRCLALDPNYLNCERTKALVLLYQGRTASALELFRRGTAKGFRQGRASSFVAPMLAAQDRATARQLMDHLGVPLAIQPELEHLLLDRGPPDPAAKARLAAFLAQAGSSASGELSPSRRALWLRDFEGVAQAQRLDTGMIIAWERIPAAFRESAGFKRLLQEAGIVDYWRKHGFPPQCRAIGEGFGCDPIGAVAAQ